MYNKDDWQKKADALYEPITVAKTTLLTVVPKPRQRYNS